MTFHPARTALPNWTGSTPWTEGERAWFFLAEISDAYPSYTLRKKRMAPDCSRS